MITPEDGSLLEAAHQKRAVAIGIVRARADDQFFASTHIFPRPSSIGFRQPFSTSQSARTHPAHFEGEKTLLMCIPQALNLRPRRHWSQLSAE